MNDILPHNVLANIDREKLKLPDHPAIDRVRESMRQHFYFGIIQYAVDNPNDQHVLCITDEKQWEIRFQHFWDSLPYFAQLRVHELFSVMIRGWATWTPREKEVTARGTMQHFLEERRFHFLQLNRAGKSHET